ncbi:MAG: InlB B-repeat-containing protein [Paludibacteraceae bacterium]|nr:InlB B-repeat-containing protein [Paludibacteraceae bacterium]
MKKFLFLFCLTLGTLSLSATNDTINLSDASYGINQVDASYYVSGIPAQAYYSFSIWNNNDDYPELRIEAKVNSDVYIQGTHVIDLGYTFLEFDDVTKYTVSQALFSLKFTGKDEWGDPWYDILAVVNASDGKVYRFEGNMPIYAYDADDNPLDLKDTINPQMVIPVIYQMTYDLAGGALEAGKSNPDSYIADYLPITLNNPVREGYTFAGWTGSNGDEPQKDVTLAQGTTGDKAYTANWTINKYTITWLNEDGTEIDKTEVEYGQVPTHDAPTKEATAEFTFTFAGWTPEVVSVTGEASYQATFSSDRNKYTITWLNEDGTEIDKTEVEYGQVPTHDAPTKEATAEFTFTFAGWTPEVVAVTGEATYQATFESHPVDPTAINNLSAGENIPTRKVIINGEIYILRGEKIYTITGQEIVQ